MIRRVLITAALGICAGAITTASQPHSVVAGGPPSPQAPGMYALNLKTGQVVTAGPLDSPDSATEHAWSPDSTKLAVGAAADSHGGHGGLQIVDVTTGAVTSVAASNQGYAYNLAWSPDGSQLAFIWRSQIGEFGVGGSSLQLWRARDRSLQSPVPSGARLAAWTPDGSGITAVIVPSSRDSDIARGRMVTLDPNTGEETATILSGRSVECQIGIAWSPDGRYLAYGGHGFHEGCLTGIDLGLWSWEAATGTTRHLFDGTSSAPQWMADGTVLAQVAATGGPTGLLPIALTSFQPDGSGRRALVTSLPNMFPPPYPAFQTARNEVLYATQSCEGAAAWVVDPGGSQARNLTSQISYALNPHLSADGRTVAFSGVGSQGGYLALAPVDHGPTTTPLTGAPGVAAGDFSPDNRWIVFGVVTEQPTLCLGP